MAKLPRIPRRRTGRRDTLAPAALPRWLPLALAALFVVLLLVDLTGLRYGYLDFEKLFGGYAITALFAGVAALLLALALRNVLLRGPAFYGEDDLDGTEVEGLAREKITDTPVHAGDRGRTGE